MKNKKAVILSIDTADNKIVKLDISIGGNQYVKIRENNWASQALLPAIEEFLHELQLKPADLTAVEVNTKQGSFTGIRVGLAVANALSFMLKIPVNGSIKGVDGH